MLKISVIIPIYNVEKYLTKCLDSVINQTYKNLEIICVNDCSPDNSLKILKKYISKDNRIKIVNRKKNGGLSAARNSGLDIATGEYIYFLDSDDWIDLDYIEKMVEAAEISQANVIYNANVYEHRPNKEPKLYRYIEVIDIKDKNYINSKECIQRIHWNTWMHLWKKDFLETNKLRFPEGYNVEDLFFQGAAYSLLADNIFIICKSAYHYNIRENSIMGKFDKNSDEQTLSILKILEKLYIFYQERNLLKKIEWKMFICMGINKKETLLKIKEYFTKIIPYVKKNKHLYTYDELIYFQGILKEDKNIQKTTMFAKLRIKMLGAK